MLKMKEVIECICFTFSFHQFLLSVCDHLTSNAIPFILLFLTSFVPGWPVLQRCGEEKRQASARGDQGEGRATTS